MSDTSGHAVVFELIDQSRKFMQQLIDENEQLQGRLAALADEGQSHLDLARARERAHELEAENEKLANLYVASCRLAATEGLVPTLEVVREVVVNLIGSEDFALLVRQHDSDQYQSILANGPLQHRSPAEIVRDPRVAEAVRLGGLQVAPDTAPDPQVSAAVPLLANGQAVGLLVVGQLLPQKPGLVPLDLEIFDLLGQQVAGRLLAGVAQRRVTSGIAAFDLRDFEGVAVAALPSHRRS